MAGSLLFVGSTPVSSERAAALIAAITGLDARNVSIASYRQTVVGQFSWAEAVDGYFDPNDFNGANRRAQLRTGVANAFGVDGDAARHCLSLTLHWRFTSFP